MTNRIYHYVGSKEIREAARSAPAGKIIRSTEELLCWLKEVDTEVLPDGTFITTFVIDTQGDLNAKSNSEWIQLFNSKDLTGWTPKFNGSPLGENFGETFRVEDGLLKVVVLDVGFANETSYDGIAFQAVCVFHPMKQSGQKICGPEANKKSSNHL